MLALVLGMLIGVERERRRVDQGYAAFAGLRTFGLIGLVGGLFAHLASEPLVAVGAALTGLLALAAYLSHRDRIDRGLTTGMAMLVTYGLGVLSLRAPHTAAGLAVVVTLVLALRGVLHTAVREKLRDEELRDGLLFLVFALVVLPLAPDVRVGPYGAVHPPSLTRLVVVLMAVNGLGHIAQRVLGPRHGLTIAGFAGGFVSSSATVAAMSAFAKEEPARWQAASAGAIASCVATVVQYALIVGTIDLALLAVLGPALVSALVVALAFTAALGWMGARTPPPSSSVDRPFRLWTALAFVAMYCAVSTAAAALHARVGTAGIVLVSAAAGLVDAHSTAGSLASLHHSHEIDAESARLAALAAFSSNSVTKLVLAWSGRTLRFGAWTSVGIVLIAAALWLAIAA